MAGEDFVHVRLSPEGLKWIEKHNGKSLRVATGLPEQDFVFLPGEVKRVSKAFDWAKILAETVADGEHMFELAPDPDAATQSQPSAAAESSDNQ